MERHPGAQSRVLVGGQQQPVDAEIVKPDLLAAKGGEHRPEAALPEKLAREQVIALERGIVAGVAAVVDRAEGDDSEEAERPLGGIYSRHTLMKFRLRAGRMTSLVPSGSTIRSLSSSPPTITSWLTSRTPSRVAATLSAVSGGSILSS